MNFSLKLANYILQKSLISISKNDDDIKNAVCSPVSIDAVLNILALGCRGPTLEQLLQLLGCDTVKDFNATASILAGVLKESKGVNAPGISFLNTLWVDQQFPLKASFREVLRDEFNTEAWAADFSYQVITE